MDNYKPKYEIGTIIIINQTKEKYRIVNMTVNDYCYYEMERVDSMPLVTPFIDCKLLDDNSISLNDIRTQKYKRINY